MIIIRQNEIEELSSLLSSCGILPIELVKGILDKRGKTPEQMDTIINQMVKRKLAAFDDSKTYLRANKSISLKDLRQAYVKTLWLFVDLIESIDDYYIQFELPHSMTFHKKDANDDNPFYDVLYFGYGSEMLDCYNTNNRFRSNDSVNAFIIIENESQINLIKLNDNIKVISYVLVKSNGTVKYVHGNN